MAHSVSKQAVNVSTLKPNIGVFTNPDHDLYLAECSPTPAELSLGEEEVLVHVKATGDFPIETKHLDRLSIHT